MAPNIVSNRTLDAAANKFLPDLDISQLQPHEQDNARNLTSAILSFPQGGVKLVFTLDVPGGGTRAVVEWRDLTDSRGILTTRGFLGRMTI
jgi:hypothetical protein